MSLAPIYTKESGALILGTWPSPKSRAMAFYYGHPQNRFWPLMASLTREAVPAVEDIEAKRNIILAHGLALWDTIESCEIVGAQDATIRNEKPNDICAVLNEAPIKAIFCNGSVAYRMYEKHLHAVCGIEAVRLPSTSPANAACSMQQLTQVWGSALAPYLK